MDELAKSRLGELAHGIALDAARYQWLRKQMLGQNEEVFKAMDEEGASLKDATPDQFDAIIDQIMKKVP